MVSRTTRRALIGGGGTFAALALLPVGGRVWNWSKHRNAHALLEPSSADKTVSMGFVEASKIDSSLAQLRRTVCFVTTNKVVTAGRWSDFGSAVLLDKEGTLALSGHQAYMKTGGQYWSMTDKDRATFFLGPNEKCDVPFMPQYVNRNLDLAFASMDPADVKKHNLMPITWGEVATDVTSEEQIYLVGAQRRSMLHVAKARGLRFVPTSTVNLNEESQVPVTCRVVSEGEDFPDYDQVGLSGGGLFARGKYLGTCSAFENFSSISYCPAEAAREGYAYLYPSRATRSGISHRYSEAIGENTPMCNFNKREYITLRS